MTGINIVTKLFIILAVIIVSAISPCTPVISDRRLCFDKLCSVPVSSATTLMDYGSNDPSIMSFKSNIEVTVFSKSAGKRQDLWGVEINGKRGYVPVRMLRETKVYKKKLIHEVPTEDIATNNADDDPKKHEAKKDKHVPNIVKKNENTLDKTVAEPTEKTSTISENVTSPSMFVPDQVSPSYEIHDGTRIPLAQHDEPAKPSYSTQIPQGVRNMEQQPILSIHPSIASTLAFKTGGIPVDERAGDAEKYLEDVALKDQSRSEKIAEEPTTELPIVPPAQDASHSDVNNTSEAKLADSATNPDAVTDGKTGNVTERANVPSSQQSIENATKNDSAKLENENKPNNIETVVTITEAKPEYPAASLDNQTPSEVGKKASEQPLPSEKIQSATVETSTEAASTELPANNAETEKNVANQDGSGQVLDNNNNFSVHKTAEAADNSEAVDHADVTKNRDVAKESEENLSDDEESEDEDEDEENDESDDEDDLPEVNDDIERIEDSLPDDQQPANAEPVEATSAEETHPNNLSIMNPLFNRLAMIPNIVKEIVEKTMSLDDSEEKATENEEKAVAAEPEAKNLDVNKVSENSEPRSPPVDFSTDNNHVNEYENDIDNSKPAVGYSEQDTANTEVEKLGEKFVNSNNKVDLETSNVTTADSIETKTRHLTTPEEPVQPGVYKEDEVAGFREDNLPMDETSSFNGFPANRNLLNVGSGLQPDDLKYEGQRQNEKIMEHEPEPNVGGGLQPDDLKYDEQRQNEKIMEHEPEPNVSGGLQPDDLKYDEQRQNEKIMEHEPELNVGGGLQPDDLKYDAQRQNENILDYQPEPSLNDAALANNSVVDSSEVFQTQKPTEISDARSGGEAITESLGNEYVPEAVENPAAGNSHIEQATFTETTDSCLLDSSCEKPEGDEGYHNVLHEEGEEEQIDEDAGITYSFTTGRNYWETLTYLVVTAFTTLLFSLGYYYIENTRRDGQLIAKINLLEKELLVASKECMVLDDTLKSTKTKLDSIEDESFGSNEMVVSLKADLEASKAAKSELEEQVCMLEKELESATEAGLELERMLREILSTNNQDNPLAQSVEDLQTRLNAQQTANEALTNALNLKAQENETLTADLAGMTQKCEQLEVEVTRVTEELKHQNNVTSNLEQTLLDKVAQCEKQVKDISAERVNLRKQLKGKEMELKDLLEVVNQMNINNLDLEKLYNVSRVKADASQLLEERNELQIRLSEVEGAHELLEEHVKIINEEVSSLSEQCKLAEKAKRDAETRVEVLDNFFKEKEAQRQKEEAVWLQKQGEVSSTVERLHTMQNEIHNYKQQIEMLKREILDQEREYKNQIAGLETKSHEHWVIARQNERRLEESKAEAGQLRNRLTLVEKNLNDIDPEAKLHRLEANGETATSPQLFIGAEASSSPLMFTGSSGVPFPPPPSHLYGLPPPPFLPPPTRPSPGIPPYEVGQRPPPLGGRLSSPPPLPGLGSGRYDNPRSPPPPLSPSMLPPFGPPHRAYPPPFANDRIHPPPPPHSSMLPPHLGPSAAQPWSNDTLPPLRNSGFHAHQQHQRNQHRARNHKGSLHSSGESLDKNV